MSATGGPYSSTVRLTPAGRRTRARKHAGTTYQPKNKDSGQPLELEPATVRKHLAGWITVGLYAINPQSQRCKWIAIDADYDDAFFDLGKLKGELELDGVSPALEMSTRGGHLWIFCEQPLLAEQCRVYVYNVALRLGVPGNYYTQCPSCAQTGHDRAGDNLAISISDSSQVQMLGRLYERNAVGQPIPIRRP